MKFEISETVHTPDPEMVLRALEICSRDVSSDVVRFGDSITLRGLGPSPRVRNAHDETVFRVNAEDDKTVINGEVNFQASALLGEQSQDEVVRSKLEGLFQQMKAQIDLDSRRAADYADPEATEAAIAVDSPAHSELEEDLIPAGASQRRMEARSAGEERGLAATALIAEPVAEPAGEPFRDVVQRAAAKPVVAPERTESLQQEELKLWFKEPEEIDSGSHVGRWAVGLVALLLLAAGSFFFYRSHRMGGAALAPKVSQPATVPATPAPAPVSNAKPPDAAPAVDPPVATSAPAATPSAPATASSAPATPSTSPSAGPAGGVTDPKVWLHGWASAMQTRDANAQAAFYADTVDRYLDQRNVSREDVLRDRESTIHMRQGLWTVKMEKIVVEQQSDTEAQVRLVKHFIDEPDPSSGILESFVPSRLTLKRVGGEWKITSEQDLSSPTPAPAVVPIPIEPSRR
jgi:hypothetical protein